MEIECTRCGTRVQPRGLAAHRGGRPCAAAAYNRAHPLPRGAWWVSTSTAEALRACGVRVWERRSAHAGSSDRAGYITTEHWVRVSPDRVAALLDARRERLARARRRDARRARRLRQRLERRFQRFMRWAGALPGLGKVLQYQQSVAALRAPVIGLTVQDPAGEEQQAIVWAGYAWARDDGRWFRVPWFSPTQWLDLESLRAGIARALDALVPAEFDRDALREQLRSGQVQRQGEWYFVPALDGPPEAAGSFALMARHLPLDASRHQVSGPTRIDGGQRVLWIDAGAVVSAPDHQAVWTHWPVVPLRRGAD